MKKWVTNIYSTSKNEAMKKFLKDAGFGFKGWLVIGDPKETEAKSSEQLKEEGMFGVYVSVKDL